MKKLITILLITLGLTACASHTLKESKQAYENQNYNRSRRRGIRKRSTRLVICITTVKVCRRINQKASNGFKKPPIKVLRLRSKRNQSLKSKRNSIHWLNKFLVSQALITRVVCTTQRAIRCCHLTPLMSLMVF